LVHKGIILCSRQKPPDPGERGRRQRGNVDSWTFRRLIDHRSMATRPSITPLAEPSLHRAFRGHRGPVTALQVNPNEQQAVSSSLDGCIFVWHFRPQLRPYRFVGHKGEVYDVDVSSSGQQFASASADKTVRIWANSPQGDSREMKVHTAAVRSVCFSKDDSLLLTASDDKTVKMWGASNQRFHGSFTGHTNWVYSAAFCKDTALVASGGEDKTVRIWDVEKKASLMTFHDFEAAVSKVRFHPDGSCVAACGHDGCVKLWDLRSRRLLQHYDAHAGAVLSIAFRGDGEYLLSSAEDETVKLWDLREGRLLYKVLGHQKAATACAFAPSGKSFISGDRDGLIFLWDCAGAGAGTPLAAPGGPLGVLAGDASPAAALQSHKVAGGQRRHSPPRVATPQRHRSGRPKSQPGGRQRPVGAEAAPLPAVSAAPVPAAAPLPPHPPPAPPGGQAAFLPWSGGSEPVGQSPAEGSSTLRDFAWALHAAFGDCDAAFAAFDINGTGVLSASEFQYGAELIHFAGDAQSVFRQIDVDRRGSIQRQDFVEFWHHTQPPGKEMEHRAPAALSPTPDLPGAALQRAPGLNDLPAPLAQTLRSMQGHLEIVARTVQLLERRLAMTEKQVVDMRKELLRQQAEPGNQAADTMLPPPLVGSVQPQVEIEQTAVAAGNIAHAAHSALPGKLMLTFKEGSNKKDVMDMIKSLPMVSSTNLLEGAGIGLVGVSDVFAAELALKCVEGVETVERDDVAGAA